MSFLHLQICMCTLPPTFFLHLLSGPISSHGLWPRFLIPLPLNVHSLLVPLLHSLLPTRVEYISLYFI